MILYADDTNIFLADKDIDSLISKTNSDLHKVSNWFSAIKKNTTSYIEGKNYAL